MSHHVVSLEVPAMPEYAQVVRMAGAAVVGLYDVTFDVVDDIRMLVDEAFILLLKAAVQADSRVSFSFTVVDETLFITVSVLNAGGTCDRQQHSFGFGIIDALCDNCEVDDSSDSCVISLTYHLMRG